MVKRLLALLAVAGSSFAGPVYWYTNDLLSLDPAAHPLTLQQAQEARYTITALQGETALNLTGMTGVWAIRDLRDGMTVASYTGSVVNAAAGTIRFIGVPPPRMEAGVTFEGSARVFLSGAEVAQIAWDYITVSNAALGTAGPVVNITNTSGSITYSSHTTLVEVAVAPVITGMQVNAQSSNTFNQIFNVIVTNGVASVNGIPTGGVTIAGSGEAGVSATGNVVTVHVPAIRNAPQDGNTRYWTAAGTGDVYSWTFIGGPSAGGAGTGYGVFTGVGANRSTNVYVGGTYTDFIVPGGITQMCAWAWGGGGGGGGSGIGGPAGFMYAEFLTIPGEVLRLWPAAGGRALVSSSAVSSNMLIGGGKVSIAGTSTAGEGGGASAIQTLAPNTNWIIVAAGGGGGGPSGFGTGNGGAGGGIIGGNGGYTTATNAFALGAYATDQFGVGATAGTNNYTLSNTCAGASMRGGNAFRNAGNFAAPGGGSGYFGGAGFCFNTNTPPGGATGGGGGVSYASTGRVTYAVTERGSGTYTPGSYLPANNYPAGVGAGGANSSIGANGAIILGW